MKFLYKIYSRYDGFRPRSIPDRQDGRGRLVLGWRHYIDVLEPGADVWVFFHGHRSYRQGVYAKGFVHEIDATRSRVLLRLREWSADEPLVDEQTNELVADAVSQRGRQVFFLPEELRPAPDCDRRSCAARQCEHCPKWHGLPVIPEDAHRHPSRLPDDVPVFAAAYWVIPPRSFVFRLDRPLAREVHEGSDLFYTFKTGEQRLAYPLARGAYEALRRRDALDFDAIVPIPLSPDKKEVGELHRTKVLATELGRLLGVPVVEAISLREPISKRRLRNSGWSATSFEARYKELLDVSFDLSGYPRVLLVDDVCDRGSTLRCGIEKVQEAYPQIEITVVTAGQMVIREAVRDTRVLVR